MHIDSGVRRGGEHLSADVHLAGRPHAGLQALPGHPQELILPLRLTPSLRDVGDTNYKSEMQEKVKAAYQIYIDTLSYHMHTSKKRRDITIRYEVREDVICCIIQFLQWRYNITITHVRYKLLSRQISSKALPKLPTCSPSRPFIQG